MVASTLMVTVGAMTIAIQIGIGVAAYLSDVAHWRVREIVKPIVEILAGIPSVVIGFLGIVRSSLLYNSLLCPLCGGLCPVYHYILCELDFGVDDLNDQIFRELLTYMLEDPSSIKRAVDLILVGRHLERIADHATNISEDVIYFVKGKTIKHHFEHN